MKKWMIIALLVVISAGCYFVPRYYTRWQWGDDNQVSVFILYNKKNLEAAPFIADAYSSVLSEEGVPHRLALAEDVIDLDAEKLAVRVPAIILPEYIIQMAPEGLSGWLKEYLDAGGNVAVVYDAATLNDRGRFLREAALSELVGLNYINAYDSNIKAYDNAKIEFANTAALDLFEITPGKTVRGTTLGDIGLDEAKFHVAHSTQVKDIPQDAVYAYALTDSQKKVPALLLKKQGKGNLLYVNMTLGFLKAHANDMPLRSIMRTFLFKVAKTPHFMNTENGIGTFVINWGIYVHLDDHILRDKIAQGYFRKDIETSIHIAAGEFLYEPGDRYGFDAAGRGYGQLKALAQYGTIGSLGGWSYNWFIRQMEQGEFTEKEIREYIEKNNKTLENITGEKIREYTAPGGLHSQPLMTKIIGELGMNSYSYFGDYGSAPNRTFVGRKKISDDVIAFPVTPYGKFADLWEYQEIYPDKSEIAYSEIGDWLADLSEFVEKKKNVRTFFLHEQNMFYFQEEILELLDKLGDRQKKGHIKVTPMSKYADFFKRFLATKYDFTLNGKTLNVSYTNPENLKGIVLALPKARYAAPEDGSLEVTEDEGYYYVKVVDEQEKQKNISVTAK